MHDHARRRTFAVALLLAAATLLGICDVSFAGQTGRGIVIDQTGLPLPGASVQLMRGAEVVTTVVTEADGTFAIDPALKGDTLVVSLDGFETARAAGAKIVLSIGRATEETTVIALAPTLTPASPTTALLGSSLTADTVSRLPSSRLKARESLPLLPSVVRGPDGLMQLGGARAHETPVLLDGFNVTDPATGNSNLNLPFESVRGVDALRDPMSVTYGDLLGGVVQIASRRGGDKFALGVQGVVPLRVAGLRPAGRNLPARARERSRRKRRGSLHGRRRVRLRADSGARRHARRGARHRREERDGVRPPRHAGEPAQRADARGRGVSRRHRFVRPQPAARG
jgi:outer membrane receptor protein involved in Fe transport